MDFKIGDRFDIVSGLALTSKSWVNLNTVEVIEPVVDVPEDYLCVRFSDRLRSVVIHKDTLTDWIF